MDMIAPCRQRMPLLVLPDHATQLLDVTQGLRERLDAEGSRSSGKATGAAPPGGYQVDNGTALIPLMGALLPRVGFVGARYGVTGYDGLAAEMARAADDPAVDRIALMVDSPGGFVKGIDGAAAAIRGARAKKPMLAVVDGLACSAAYWLASQAGQITATSLSEIGSIGVIAAHVDATAAAEKAGLKVTLITSGAHKADLHPLNGPMSDEIRASEQARIDKLRGRFADEIAIGRPALGAARALATEAAVFDAADAVRLGLVDQVMPVADALTRFATGAIGARPTSTTVPGASGTTSLANPQPEDTIMTTFEDGAKAAQARCAAIMTSPHAAGRDRLAKRLAFESTMSAEEAVAILENAPQGEAPRTTTLGERGAASMEFLQTIGAAAEGSGGRASSSGDKPKATVDTTAVYAGRRAVQVQG